MRGYSSFVVIINVIFWCFLLSAILGASRVLSPPWIKPGSQYDAGASVASRTARASSAKIGVPVHNLAFASVGGVVEGVSEGGSLYEPRP